MQRSLLSVSVLLLLLSASVYPESVRAVRAPASFEAARSLLIASSSPGNAYLAGVSVVNTAPVLGDLSAFGGSVVVAAPVKGDALLFAGSASVRAPVSGDLRIVSGNVNVMEPVAGDLVAFGYEIYSSDRPGGSVFITAMNTTLAGGAAGPVTIYGNNILLKGTFDDDVTIMSSGHVALAASTTILGKLSYQAPESARIPASAIVRGGIEYTSASYLPDAGTSRILGFVSMGFFLFARILGALILAGLLAGLFPRLADAVVERAYAKRTRSILLTMLLGFAVLVAAPVLLLLLLLTFVGIGLALLLLLLYVLLVLLAIMYAGILTGSLFARRFMHRDAILWHDGALGMLALSLVALVPVIGVLIAVLLTIFSAGALLQISFSFAFPHEEHTRKTS